MTKRVQFWTGQPTRRGFGNAKPMSARQSRPVFIVCLQPQKGVEPIRALRGALKTLFRRHGLRCATVKWQMRNAN
jgi:hypothetical protein